MLQIRRKAQFYIIFEIVIKAYIKDNLVVRSTLLSILTCILSLFKETIFYEKQLQNKIIMSLTKLFSLIALTFGDNIEQANKALQFIVFHKLKWQPKIM